MTEPVSLAIAYYLNGTGFRMSAEKLSQELELDGDGRPKKLAAIPMYFLASHAAELFLKAALLKRGFAEADLRKYDYRHDLEALLQELQDKQVPISGDTVAVVCGLSAQHKNHQLRYTVLVDDGTKTYWPPIRLVFAALDELLLLTRLSTHGV